MEYSAEQMTELTKQLQAMVAEQVGQWMATLAETGEAGSLLEQAERVVRDGMRQVGQQALQGVLASVGTGATTPAPTCAACERRLHLVRYQNKALHTLLGRVTVKRAYYRCPACGQSAVPLDATLGVGAQSLSQGVQDALCQLGVNLPFARVAALLANLLGVRVDDNTIQRTVTQVGERLLRQQTAQQEALWESATPPPFSGPAPTRLYLSVDGTTVHLEEGWKEVKVAALYETEACYRPDAPAAQRAVDVSYVVSFAPANQFARLVYLEAVRRGLHEAQEVVVLGDGASWIWKYIPDFCDEPVEILDYYHATEHLWQAAHARYEEGDPRARKWVDDLLNLLFEEGPDALLHRLWETCNQTWGEVREVLRATLTYFTNNRQRIDYRALRQADYHIGSGTVESACKRLIGARLKQAGMRWSRRGAQAVAHLRALFLSDRWHEVWHDASAAAA